MGLGGAQTLYQVDIMYSQLPGYRVFYIFFLLQLSTPLTSIPLPLVASETIGNAMTLPSETLSCLIPCL